jgi:CRISPR-associated protein Csx10
MTELLPEALKGRDKKNFFEADGRKGMEAIDRLLDEMATLIQQQTLAHDPQAWRIGLQMLAARIAEPARKKAQERR